MYADSRPMQLNAPVISSNSEHQLTSGNPHLVRRDDRHFEFVGLNISERFLITFDPANTYDMDVVFLSSPETTR